MSQTQSSSFSGQQSGFALVVVLIVTMLTLAVIVTTVSIAMTRSFSGGHASRQGDQALLAAQSGLDSFLPRMRAGGYTGTIYSIECWMEGYSGTELSTTTSCPTTAVRNLPVQLLTSDANGPRATVDVVGALDEVKSTFTIRSTGLVGEGSTASKAVITQQVKLTKPNMLNVAPPAALTSCPAIKGGGSATIDGGAQAQTGVVPVWTNFSTSATRVRITGPTVTDTWPRTVTLSDPTLVLGRGNYISVGGVAYKVEQRKSDTELVISPADLQNPPAVGSSLSGDLSLIPFALRSSVTATGNTAMVERSTQGKVTLHTYRLPFSDPSGVYKGDVLYVPIPNASGTMTTYAVTVTGKGYVDNDPEQGYVDVALSVTNEATNLYNVNKGSTTIAAANRFVPPTAAQLLSIRPGTAFSRYIAGGTSASTINDQLGTSTNTIVNWGGATTVGPAAMAGNSALDCSSEDALFKQVFNNISPSEYYSYVAAPDRLAAFSTLPMLRSRLYWYGPKTYPSSNNYSFSSSDLCGSGVLIINGNLDMQGTCSQGFTGVLYVMGDLKNAGNGTINGAVIVQGVSTLSESSFTGSLNIKFDQTAIVRSARELSRPVFTLNSGTWSQQ